MSERVAHMRHDAQGGGLCTDCNRNSAFSFAVGRHFVRDHQKLGGARVYAFFCCSSSPFQMAGLAIQWSSVPLWTRLSGEWKFVGQTAQ